MVVVAIVGVLSAVALPNFLGNAARAEAQANIGAIKAFADQCNTNIQTENPSALVGLPLEIIDTTNTTNVAADPTNDLPATRACGEVANDVWSDPAGAVTFFNLNAFASPEDLAGVRCGRDVHSGAAEEDVCTFTVPATGGPVTGQWS